MLELGHVDLTVDNKNAMAMLVCMLSKADFKSMHMLRKSSCGFIVARLHGAANDNLFIVDQHTVDEEYDFEVLQVTTQLELQ